MYPLVLTLVSLNLWAMRRDDQSINSFNVLLLSQLTINNSTWLGTFKNDHAINLYMFMSLEIYKHLS